MRFILVLGLALSFSVSAAPTWQTVSSEPGKRIELDRTSIKREDDGKLVATGRVVLDRELSDPKSGGTYRVIEATTRYDCASRNATTIKRIFKKNETEILREEELKSVELPVRSGTLDDKVLREVCRPPREDAKAVAEKVREAAVPLKQANDAMIKRALQQAGKEAAPVRVVEKEVGSPLATNGEESRSSSGVDKPAARSVRRTGGGKNRENGSFGDPVVQHASIHWSYEGEGGPDNWHRLDPKHTLCGIGQRQSPIDIRDGIKVDLEPIKFDYRPSYFRIVDNGHTLQVVVGDGSLTVTGKTYELVQFHFHKPSEEKINGQRFDMVVHLVHKSDDGKLAVVAVLLERGAENPFIQTLWNNLPLEKGMEVAPPADIIDLNTLLPVSRNYYTYMGSLTTPPCTEGVLWLVMRQPVQISQEQINIFSRLYRHNARPIQPSWGRLLKEGR